MLRARGACSRSPARLTVGGCARLDVLLPLSRHRPVRCRAASDHRSLMCGIAGVFGDPDPHRVQQMIAAIRHRGPDSRGEHHAGRVALGACRLSVIDPIASDQPIDNERGDTVIVFNGEIYNYRELQRHLRDRGHVFRSDGDTEVVLHLYEEYGADCVRYLRGMFAFAVSDGRTLFIARDRLGIKPLY
jgi:asparagine synthase (glutamine-hydrolysing)